MENLHKKYGNIVRLGFGKYPAVIVFDPETVADRASFEDPLQFPVGVRDVLVGGECVVREERLTGRQPGKIVK
jgi:N-acyl-D-aspartate/D-glutamate deacylase